MKKKAEMDRVQKRRIPITRNQRSTPGPTSGFANIVERYKYAVVNIEVMQNQRETKYRSRFSMPWELFEERPPSVSQQTMNIGTGFVFDAKGYIITNEHVIHGADLVQVKFFGDDRPIKARVVGTNYDLDLAVLKVVLPKKTAVLSLGDPKDVRVGEWVMAIGNPLGLDHTVTVGVISAKERPITIGDRHYEKLIQTDAAINRGNSGGPLINLRGQVIGINTAVSQSSHGIGFAISVDIVKNAIKNMMKNV